MPTFPDDVPPLSLKSIGHKIHFLNARYVCNADKHVSHATSSICEVSVGSALTFSFCHHDAGLRQWMMMLAAAADLIAAGHAAMMTVVAAHAQQLVLPAD